MAESDPNSPVPDPPISDPDATQAMESSELIRILDQYMAELNSGVAPDRAKLLADHPNLASQLEQCLAGIDFIHRAALPAGNPTQLGDFRILRELGRGGMGVVYEAEQISLRRRVALKVLRFGAVADKEALERFRREGETIAHLHHTNIVPIFAIGSEHGVAYYAMQLIEGGNLADMTARQNASFTEIARWGLEAAEALAHAHQRGVIHRDVKPSNLLLDADGRVWLTDFGLARRMDEVTLTMVGLAGTPRYMSPEQATAVRRPIDHRTDIYSLGATLYELATGQPLFASDTPHGVISQILTTEPVRPRIIRPSMPRDLETIILKCLAKEPAQRYATAQALADDLRAFREGRTVKARPARLPERAVRWVKSRKKSVAVASIAAVATLVLSAGLFVALRRYSAAQLVHISMANDGAPLKVEVLDESERNAIATFTAPTQEAQALPPGKYHVRFSAAGRLSETSLFDAAAGCGYQFTAGLSPRDLWEIPIDGGESVELARIDGRDDLFVSSENKLRRMRGDTGQNVWAISLDPKNEPLVAKVLTAADSGGGTVFGPRQVGGDLGTMTLVRPLADLDGDGTPDLVWASRCSASLVAVSGKTGKVIWCHRCQTVPARGGQGPSAGFESIFFRSGMIVGQPLMADVDGKKVVAAMCSVAAPHPHPQVWLEGISALSGQRLWRRPLPPINAANGQEPICVSACAKLHGRTIGAIAYGNRLIGFDFLTGEPAWPDRVLDATPPVVIRFGDLLGDGQIGVLFVRNAASSNPNARGTEFSVVALSPVLSAPLWERPLANVTLPYWVSTGPPASQFDWPLAVDLAGKGHPEVVIPWVDYSANSCGVEVLDGRTGVTRWKHRLSGATRNWPPPQPDRMVAGPDLGGDGYHELIVASCDQRASRAYVDALCGSDGSSRWTFSRPDPTPGPPRTLSPLRWWQAGRDGRPMLVVSRCFDDAYSQSFKNWAVMMLASTGQVEHELNEFGDPQVADLNGDGIPDLFARYTFPSNAWSPGMLRTIRGMPPTAWRMLSNDPLVPTADLNGDGIADLVCGMKGISGKDGSLLWESNSSDNLAYAGQTADLKGDGAPVLLSLASDGQQTSVTLRAMSGRDGKSLWSAKFQSGAGEWFIRGTVLGCPILESGRPPEVLFTYGSQEQKGDLVSRFWLARIAGDDGQIRWRQPLSEPNVPAGEPGPIAIADLNGDGVADIVLWVPLGNAGGPAANPGIPGRIPRAELRAYSGRDGKLLWRRPGFYDETGVNYHSTMKFPTPRPLVIYDNGRLEILITEVFLGTSPEKSYAQVVALDGHDGKAIWSWRGDDATLMGQGWTTWADALLQVARTPAGPAIVVSVLNQNSPSPEVKTGETSVPAAPAQKAGHQIVMLDLRGHVLTRTDVMSGNAQDPIRQRVWVHDLCGDGLDELVWADDSSIHAMRAGSVKPLWESRSETGVQYSGIVAILPAGKNYPATVVVKGAMDGLLGLSGPTGKIRWRCESSESASPLLLETSDPLGLPRVCYHNEGGRNACRPALLTDDAGVYLPAVPVDVERPEPAADPRLLVPLPWTPNGPPTNWSNWLLMTTNLAGTIAVLIWACRRRSWRRWIAVIASWAGLAVPIAAAIWVLAGPRRGPRIAVLVMLWIGTTVLAASLWLWLDSRSMLAVQHYDWSEGYHGLFQLFLLGVAATIGLFAAVGMVHLAHRVIKRLFRTAAVSPIASA